MPPVHVRAALAAALVCPGLAFGVAHADPARITSGAVTLRTTDDAGSCADAPQARAVAGRACPTFTLYYAVPAHSRPKGLVVFFHGHGHNGDQYASQLADVAQRDGVVAVAPATAQLPAGAPSYRGPFQSVDEEARDAASAITWARHAYPSAHRTYLFGTSMGGSGLAYFLDAATRPATAADADARWVQRSQPFPLAGLVDAEGIGNLAETWAEATAVEQPTPVDAQEIEAETGGTPATAPDAYRARSLARVTPAQLAATGLPVAGVVHDLDDGLVPYNQTLETRAAFAAGGVALQTYDIAFKDSCTQGDQTTATSHAPVPGGETALCLAGHANENNSTTPVMRTALHALDRIVGGDLAGSAQTVNSGRPAS